MEPHFSAKNRCLQCFSLNKVFGNPANFGEILAVLLVGMATLSNELAKKWTLPEPLPDFGILGSNLHFSNKLPSNYRHRC